MDYIKEKLKSIKIKNNSLKDFYKLIKKEYDKVKINIEDIDFLPTNNVMDTNTLTNSRFFSKEVLNYVQKHLVNCLVINCGSNTQIHFFTEHTTPNSVPEDVIGILNNICKIVLIMRRLFHNERYLKIQYFDCKLKKLFPKKKGAILTENNCNSGLSYVTNYYMIVYRREEFRRVMIHEIFHSFLGDYSLIDIEHNKNLSKYFCLKDDDNININETYTESLATIINLLFIMLENGDPESKLDDMFRNELAYSTLVMLSILRHYGYTSIEELKRVDGKKCKILPQKTSVFNYYILKPFMLINIDDLLNLTLSGKCSNKFVFSEMSLCLNAFYQLILQNFENKSFKQLVNQLLKNKKLKTNSLSMVFYK
jgi:hypothetical protein